MTEEAFFDEDYYRREYPDVAQSTQNCFHHYMSHGWREGRNPSASFITLYYRDKYLAGRQDNPLSHYVRVGWRSMFGTVPRNSDDYVEVQRSLVRPFFDAAAVSSAHGEADGDPLGHYLRRGWRDGTANHVTMSIADYSDKFSYVKQLNISPLYHYASQRRFSAQEKRKGAGATRMSRLASAFAAVRRRGGERGLVKETVAAEFDRDFYLACNPDVRQAGIDPLDHFLDHGWRENRRPNRLFDTGFYRRSNPELAAGGINAFYHYLDVGRREGRRPNPIGDHLYPPMEAPSDDDWNRVAAARGNDETRCVVVMPVFKGLASTLAALHAVLASRQKTPFALHVVDDRSPDAALSGKLAELAAKGLFTLTVNPVNVGFVQSANAALRRFKDRTVVLLNSDAKVSGDWLDRMIAHADRDATVATVTPLSNNATIFSYPINNYNNVIEMETDAAGIDRLAAEANAGRFSTVPVGVGFCLLMTVAARDAVGLFDEDAFGHGYGEEADFCLRAAKAGFRNVMAEDVFVYHVGEVSFAALAGARLSAQKLLRDRHPEYPQQIRRYLQNASIDFGRIRLDLRRLANAAGAKPVVLVSHALQGGIATHVREEGQRLQAEGIGVIVLRVGVANRWSIEITGGGSKVPFTPNLKPLAYGQFREHLADFLRWLDPGVIHIHSLVGLGWNATVGLMELIRGTGVPYRFTLHDYSVVCHRNNLVLTTGRYCGLATTERCQRCVATDETYPEAIDPEVLRTTYAAFLEGAEQVLAPSRDIADRLHRAGARYPIKVSPYDDDSHRPIASPLVRPAGDGTIVTIVTIGAIGAHKGSHILHALASDAKARQLPVRYRIIGYSDIADDLAGQGVEESGPFSSDNDALDLVRALSPDLIFLPSIWPETWSYTLSMAFALQIPPVVFDIGAPAARIRRRSFGEVLPYALINDIKRLNDRLILLARDHRARGSAAT